MTVLQPPRSSAASRGANAGRTTDARRPSTRRPLVPSAVLGGITAAGGPLLVLMAVALVGWFVTDAGSHGTPSGALRVGALGWLAAHGSTVTVHGVSLTAVPLGLTAVSAWVTWRVGHRVGESVADHGPDANRIGDGERDWTVPVATVLFATGYLLVTVGTVRLGGTVETAPDLTRAAGWALLLTGLVGTSAIATGSGRAALWLTLLPSSVRDCVTMGRRILGGWLAVATLAWLVALSVDLATAANIVSQLNADAGDAALLSVLSLGAAPNATLWSSAYLLGPGFSLGSGTLVAPATLVLGPLPLFPLLAALPAGALGSTAAVLVMLTPALVAAVVAGRVQRRLPAAAWDRSAIRGGVGGILAGLVLGWLTSLSGGAVGPGRLQAVGPFPVEVLVHAVAALGIGGLVGALATWWWCDRGSGRGGGRPASLRGRIRPPGRFGGPRRTP